MRHSTARRVATAVAAVFACSAAPLVFLSPTSSAAVATNDGRVSKSATLTRTHLIPGSFGTTTEQVVDTRIVTVKVDVTRNLRDRQPINITWTGAHPTGNIVPDPNSVAGAQQEYPVVIMQCRGVDDPNNQQVPQISPSTCWTQTPAERYQADDQTFPPYRIDRYALPSQRMNSVGVPTPVPSACDGLRTGTDHWVPFIGADGTVYEGGPRGCAGMSPDAINDEGGQPGNTTYAPTDVHGNGVAKFIVNTSAANGSLGCDAKTSCTLVVLPIMGLSCDSSGRAVLPGELPLPQADRPPAKDQALYQERCGSTGNYTPGSVNGGTSDTEALSVSGLLWWSSSNWRNRISIPLNFAPSENACDITSSGKATSLVGSQTMRQATLQWLPTFCTDPNLFTVHHIQLAEPQAKNLLENNLENPDPAGNGVIAALQGAPPQSPFSKPVVQAPVAITGFAIAYLIDDKQRHLLPKINLTPRLLAKLLTQSYATIPTIAGDYENVRGNPLDMGRDPEFKALNPTLLADDYDTAVASALYTVSSSSDVLWALTSYINADPDAHAWINGTPDPWGMKVNKSYQGISLPVAGWPQLDSYINPYITQHTPCLTSNPTPWMPAVQAPIVDPTYVSLNMQYGIANSQIVCKNAGQSNQKMTAVGRLAPGHRFMLGVVSLADADRYQMASASLLTHVDLSAAKQFADASGRTFVGPTTSTLENAVAMLKPDKALGTWPIPYSSMRSLDAGKDAYPGLLLDSLDVPSTGLSTDDAKRLSTFIRFAATTGQTPGSTFGTLPVGYLPFTATPAAKKLAAYSLLAADAVSKQQGYVPAVDGSSRPPSPSPSATPSPSDTSTPSPTPIPTPVYSSNPPAPLPTTGASTGASASPTPSTTSGVQPAPTPAPSTSLVAVGKTPPYNGGSSGVGFVPFFAALALLSGGAALLMSRTRSS